MAKPNQEPKQQTRKWKFNHSAAIEAKRAASHSPATYKKREENAWHTDPLAPIPTSVLLKQAKHLTSSLYKPEYNTLNREESKLNSIADKRKSDNSYYLNWLNKESELLQAHEDAARSQIQAAGAQAQGEVQKGWEDLHGQLQANSEAEAGSVSNMSDANAFDVSDAALLGAHEVEQQRQATNDQLATLATGAAIGSSENLAHIGALEAKRQADQWEGLNKLGTARQELRLNQGAETAKAYEAAKANELAKYQIQAQVGASERTAELEEKRFGLDKAKLNLEALSQKQKHEIEAKKLNLEALTSKEKHELEAGELTVEQAKLNVEKRGARTDEKNATTARTKVENEPTKGARTPGEKAKAAEKQTEQNQEIHGKIGGALGKIQHNPKLRKMVEQNPPKAIQVLTTKFGVNQLLAQAAVQLYTNGKVSPALERELNAAGYTGSYNWG